MLINQDVLLPAFFKGMLRGYARSELTPSKIELLDGSKVTSSPITELGVTVTDLWQTTPHSDTSWGTTTLSCSGRIVWMMQYWGEYRLEAIPFLRKALRSAYSEQKFVGGRGRSYFTDGEYTYLNITESNDFDNFNGCERVLNKNGKLLGWHKYHGMKTY